jgi:putative FmdB family regulatory protein
MPLFEFHCTDCGKDHEILVRGESTPECPTCQSKSLEKLLSVPAAPVNAVAATPISGCGVGPPCGRVGCGRRPH